MVMYDLPSYIYFSKIQLIRLVVIFDYATCHNVIPSLTIIMDDGNQYFKKKINFMSKNLHIAMC